MNNTDSYTAEEWRTLQFGILWVYAAVAGADGKLDKKEAGALDKELRESYLFKDPLAREVFESVARGFPNVVEQFKRDPRTAIQGLKDLADILDTKAERDQALAFKRSLLLVGHNVAEASGGIFGPKVSDKEKVTLTGIGVLLRAA